MTTLYIKTHNVTGLKYFGKTNKVGKELEKYKGSGLYWIRHIKKHGYNVTTEIFAQSTNIDELTKIAMDFSIQNNIVASKEWANLKEENGLNGGTDKGTNNPCYGVPKTEEHKRKIAEKSKLQRHSKETKMHLSKVAKNRPTTCCLNCKKEVTVLNFNRHYIACIKPKAVKNGNIGINNPNAKTIIIYNNNREEMFRSTGGFKDLCIQNSLPYVAFMKSYTNKVPITNIKEPNKKFIGWYALIAE